MVCPSCESEMEEDGEIEGLWRCPECGYYEHRDIDPRS